MKVIRSVTVFCGARRGIDPRFAEAARALGTGLARGGYRLVYGGGRVGLMGVLADAALAAGGEVMGVIPGFLALPEIAHDGLRELVVTDSLHSRKARLYDEGDAFVALPGGIGTLDELIETITWRALGQHAKPVLLCDVAGSAAPFVAAVEAAIGHGFASPELRARFEVMASVTATLARLGPIALACAGLWRLYPRALGV